MLSDPAQGAIQCYTLPDSGVALASKLQSEMKLVDTSSYSFMMTAYITNINSLGTLLPVGGDQYFNLDTYWHPFSSVIITRLSQHS